MSGKIGARSEIGSLAHEMKFTPRAVRDEVEVCHMGSDRTYKSVSFQLDPYICGMCTSHREDRPGWNTEEPVERVS